jgi:hypothetical protein
MTRLAKEILRWLILVVLAAGGLFWLLGSWRAA